MRRHLLDLLATVGAMLACAAVAEALGHRPPEILTMPDGGRVPALLSATDVEALLGGAS